MKFFSAFAGIGGFDKGILNIIPDAECVGYSEIDRYAQRIYARHYPNHINFGDITRIDERTIPDCDLIVGGFPCQDISIAGKRAGLEGGRSGLFYDLIRIIQEKQPRTILLENVKGLFSSDKGRDFARVLIALDEAGYDVEWENINSKHFGVPQNRERVFIVGHLRGRSWTSVFPLGQGTCNTAESGEQSQDRVVSNCLDSNYYKGADGKRTMICISDSGKGRALEERVTVPPLRANTGAGSNNIIVHCMDGRSPDRPSAKDGGSGHLSRPVGPAHCLNNKVQAIELRQIAHTNPDGSNSMAGRIYDPAGISVTLAGNGGGLGVKTGLYAVSEVEGRNIRRLTPLEAERLQGFPDKWTAVGFDEKPVSDSQRYRCLGNAVSVPVIEAIVEKLKETGAI